MGLRRILTCKCAALLFSLAALFILIVLLYRVGDDGIEAAPVNTTYAAAVLTSLCTAYHDGHISGDLCNRLCYFENLTLAEFYTSNKIVAVLLMGGQKVILKASHEYYTQYDQLPAQISENEYFDKLVDLVNYHLELEWSRHRIKHLLDSIWPIYKRAGGEKLSQADRRSLWSLANQEEYLTYSIFNIAQIFPRVTGTCGHFYAVEQLVPFKLDSIQYMNVKSKVLIHLMGTLKSLTDVLNEPFQWCDVNFENLGLSANYPKRFLIMDADHVYTDSRMRSFLASKHCKSDQDCIISDCEAVCDKSINRCSNRTNDNVDTRPYYRLGYHLLLRLLSKIIINESQSLIKKFLNAVDACAVSVSKCMFIMKPGKLYCYRTARSCEEMPSTASEVRLGLNVSIIFQSL